MSFIHLRLDSKLGQGHCLSDVCNVCWQTVTLAQFRIKPEMYIRHSIINESLQRKKYDVIWKAQPVLWPLKLFNVPSSSGFLFSYCKFGNFRENFIFGNSVKKTYFRRLKFTTNAQLTYISKLWSEFTISRWFFIHKTWHMRGFANIKTSRKFPNLQYFNSARNLSAWESVIATYNIFKCLPSTCLYVFKGLTGSITIRIVG